MRKIFAIFAFTLFLLIGTIVGTQANGISNDGLPPNVLMKETNPKSLIYGEGQVGLQAKFLQDGAIKANIYQLILKNQNKYAYGLAGDIQFGRTILQKISIEELPFNIYNTPKGQENKYLKLMLNSLIAYVDAHRDSYEFLDDTYKSIGNQDPREILFHDEKEKSYMGIVRYHIVKEGVIYSGYIHFRIYNDEYLGPSLRFVELSDYGQSIWWDSIKDLLTSKGF